MVHVADMATDTEKEMIAKCGYSDFGGETREAFNQRICQALRHLETLDLQTVAVFTHAGFMRSVLDAVLHTRLPRKHLRCSNCTIAILEYHNGNWALHSWINLM